MREKDRERISHQFRASLTKEEMEAIDKSVKETGLPRTVWFARAIIFYLQNDPSDFRKFGEVNRAYAKNSLYR